MGKVIKTGDQVDLMFYVHDAPKKDRDYYVINFWDTWGDVRKDSIKGNPKEGDEIETAATITHIDDATGYVTLRIFDSDFDVFVEDGEIGAAFGMASERGEERLCT